MLKLYRKKMFNCLSFHIAQHQILLDLFKDLIKKKKINYKISIEQISNVKKFADFFKNINLEVIESERFTKSKTKYSKEVYISNELINYIDKNYNIINDIFSRYQFINRQLSHQKKKQHIYSLISQILNLLKKKNINLIIFYQSPHHLDTYLTYLLAKFLKIKFLIIKQFSFKDKHRFCIDQTLDIFFQDLNNNNKDKFFQTDTAQYLSKIESDKEITPQYMKNNYFKFSGNINRNNLLYYFYLDIKNYLFKKVFFFRDNGFYFYYKNSYFENLCPPINLSFVILNFFLRLKIFFLKYYYKLISRDQILQQYVAFFPNYQPEASTFPESKEYADIHLILHNIFSILPKNILLVYKEHPTTFDYSREAYTQKDINFYKFLKKKYKNLIFYKYNSSNTELIDNSKFIITMTSNVAWEAYLRKKNVFICGNCWFDRFGGFFKFQEFNENLYKIINKKYQVKKKSFLEYCGNLENKSFLLHDSYLKNKDIYNFNFNLIKKIIYKKI